jgi:hypothetical protein
LAYAGGHARAPAKSCKSGVYDSGGTSYLSCSCGSCVPHHSGGVYCGVLGILGARIWCAPASIPPLIAIVYGLELHHLTPSGILHIAAFITLCKANMGIEPHFNLWNYFQVRLRLDSDVEAVLWGCADIYVRTRQGIDPYFHLSVSIPPVG